MTIRWPLYQLGRLGESVRDSAVLTKDAEYELWSVPSFANDEPEFVTGRDIGSSKLRVAPGDILICKINPRINRVWRVREPVNGCVQIASPEWLVFRPSEHSELDSGWLIHFLSSPKFRQWIESGVTGATGSHTRAKAEGILAQRLPVPPLAEQRRIVAILDEAFEGIASAKASAERNLQNARELFKSNARRVFLQGAERWLAKTVDKLSTNLDSRRVPITKSDRKPGEFPYYGASGVVDYVADYLFDGAALLISEDGANLLARSTPIAFSVSGKYWVNNHAHILEFANRATQRFVEFYLESIPLDEYITGAAQPKLNQKSLNSIPIPIPDTVAEQAEIVERLEALSERCEELHGIYERKLDAFEELKAALLSRAFAGELSDSSVHRQLAQVV